MFCILDTENASTLCILTLLVTKYILKVCSISYEDQAVNEVVNECVTQNIKDCSEAGEDECRYDLLLRNTII